MYKGLYKANHWSLRQKQNARAKDNGERGPGRANVKSNGCSRLDIICSGR